MRYVAIASVLALTACGNGATIGSGAIADAATTVHILSSPNYRELNPLIPDGSVAGGIATGLALNYGARAAAIELGGDPVVVNRTVDTIGWFAACHNLAFFAGSGHPVGLAVGAGCAYLYQTESDEHKNDQTNTE